MGISRKTEESPKLEKGLGLFEMTMYGVGIILGAGIYALLGEGAGLAGNAVWLSFIVAAIVATFTGLSYCELSSMMPKDAAEYNYTKRAFGKGLGFIVGWILLLTMIIAATTVSLGFAGYFQKLIIGAPILPVAIGILVAFSILNLAGIKESSNFNILATLIEAGGLVLIIIIGLFFFRPDIDFTFSPNGFYGVMNGAALMFFAFIGFQNIMNISEEAKDARKTVPKALILSLVISTILYILVGLSAISIVGWETLAQSSAPMSMIIERSIGPGWSPLMSIIALFATGNTILICLIVGSRMIYGMSKGLSLPQSLSKIHPRTRTPYIAILITMIISLAVLFLGNIRTIAEITTAGIFVSFIFVNASLIWLRYKAPDDERPFKVPLNIGRFPLLALFGLVTSALMLIYFGTEILAFVGLIVLIGVFIYKLKERSCVAILN